ncbi:MAG TPA: superoxide dismutase family protein [Bacteroidales bacterium]|nr:superoxide dismutase family protein [Bacteroidales bacterium]
MKSMKTGITGILFLGLLFTGCNNQGNKTPKTSDETAIEGNMPMEKTIAEYPTAEAILSPASGSSVNGKVTFTQVGDSVMIVLDATGLAPGKHAFHLHEKGDCSASDATSAGGHWNPTNMPHGKRGQGQFHKGDIDNIVAGTDSTSHFEMKVSGWTIGGSDTTNILGKAVILHAGADDFTSQPSGAAGARVACGVIEKKAQ